MGFNIYNLRADEIGDMNYADFVALFDLTNSPPGGIRTIQDWITFGNIISTSHVLDLACNHGYSTMQLSKRIKATYVGIDFSESAIHAAQTYAHKLKTRKLKFEVGNAEQLRFRDGTFSHIAAGCTFGFFRQPNVVLQECKRVLKNNGRLLVANFHYEKKPPLSLVNNVNTQIGTNVRQDQDQRWWLHFFESNFRVGFYRKYELPVLSQRNLRMQVDSLVRNSKPLLRSDKALKKAVFERFYFIRNLLNEHRRYQAYGTGIFEK